MSSRTRRATRLILCLTMGLVLAAPIASGSAEPKITAGAIDAMSRVQRLRDPLVAASRLRAGPPAKLELTTTTDLHAALHHAVESVGLSATYNEHVAFHSALSQIPSDVASGTAVLLSGIVSAGDAMQADRALAIEASIAIADLVASVVPDLRPLGAVSEDEPATSEQSCEIATNVTVADYTVLAVGSDGEDCYPFYNTLLSLDLAGDDHYDNLAGFANTRYLGFPVSVAIDLAGSDVYTEGQAYGQEGVGLLFDMAGNDAYSTLFIGQGASGGEDAVGYLADLAGNDSYRCADYCQGFGYGSQWPAFTLPNGVGVVWDRSGHDTYVVTNGTAQGYGMRTGTGVLLDSSGRDSYTAPGRSEFLNVQGASTLAGVGLLLDDGASSDEYTLTEGPGGQGTTRTLPGGSGLFFDLGGADVYGGFSRGANNASWGGVSSDLGYGRGTDCERSVAPEPCVLGLIPVG